MDEVLELTFFLPVLLVPLLLLGLAALIILAIFAIRRRRARDAALARSLEDAQTKLAALESKEAEWRATGEAYRNFIYNVAHDAANPLQSIQTNLDNWAAGMLPEQHGWLVYRQVVVEEIRRLGQLFENLRLLSQLESERAPSVRQVVNLKAIVEEVIMARSPNAEKKGVNLLYLGPAEPVRVLGNRDQLYQVVLNLVDNAVKFSGKDGGLVTIFVEAGGEMHTVRVSDEGVGITAEDLPYVFEGAYRSPNAWSFRRKGSGLGLNIAKRIVEQHGGGIHIESQTGLGTTVCFELPANIDLAPGRENGQ